MYFMWIVLKHYEEVKEPLGRHEDIVQSLQQGMETIAEVIIPVASGVAKENPEENAEDAITLSILSVLNED
jgi:hypothetical protein